MKSIKSMTLKELLKVKTKIESAIFLRIDSERKDLTKAMARVEAINAKNSSRMKTLARKPRKARKLPIRFRNPENPQDTWAGRGLRPRWLVAALKSRKNKLADFAVG
ncbi:H-NS histone family protein [soil metagenome]